MQAVKALINTTGITWQLIDLYDRIATAAGHDSAKVKEYDCRKVEVSQDLFALMKSRCQEDHPDVDVSTVNFEYNMMWCASGPKTRDDLARNEVIIDDGFFRF